MPEFKGFFNDGRTAARRGLEVSIGADTLTLIFDDGIIETWHLRSVDLVEEAYPGQPIRLKYAPRPEARLTVDDPAFLDALANIAPHFTGRVSPARRMWRGAAIGLVGAVVTGALIVLVVPWLSSLSTTLIPLAWEEDMGDKVVRRIAAATSGGRQAFCRGTDGLAALERLTVRLSDAADSAYRFRVRVIASPMVNAFAAPGGHVALMAGLIEKTESAAELAGVLAHEMGHVIGRHSTERMIRQLGFTVILDSISGGVVGSDALTGFTEILLDLSYSREAEAEADLAAIEMLRRAGISRLGLARFFERLGEREDRGISLPTFLSSHPAAADREARIRSEAGDGAAAMRDEEWLALKRVCGD